MDEQTLERFKKALETSHGVLTKEEFVQTIENIIDLISKIQKKTNSAIDTMEELHKKVMQKLDEKHSTSYDTLKKEVNALFVEERVKKMEDDHGSRSKTMEEKMASMESMHKEMMSMIEDKMSKVKDGYTPKKGKDYSDGKAPSKQEIESVLKPLVDEATKTLKKEFSEKLSRIPRGMGMKKITYVRRVNMTAQVDGSTRAFTLPKDTLNVLGVWGTSFPITFDTADWSVSGETLTLATPIGTPESGQTLFALVETQFFG